MSNLEWRAKQFQSGRGYMIQMTVSESFETYISGQRSVDRPSLKSLEATYF